MLPQAQCDAIQNEWEAAQPETQNTRLMSLPKLILA